MRTLKASSMLIALSLVGAACTGTPGNVVDGPETSETSTTDAGENPEPATATTTVVSTVALPESDAEFDEAAPILEVMHQTLEGGTYRVESLGTPFTMTIPSDWWVGSNRAGLTVFSHPESSGDGDREIALIRPTQMAYPLDPSRGPTEMASSFEIQTWLDDLVEGVVVDGPHQTGLGGEDAIYFDVQVSNEVACVPSPDFCVIFAMSRDIEGIPFSKGIDYRVWWVDGGEVEPISVVVAAGLKGEEFFEEANVLLDTLAFGEWGPHPVPPGAVLWELGLPSQVPAGMVRIPLAGGLEFELQRPRDIFQNPGLANFAFFEHNGDLMMFTAPETAAGDPIEAAEDVVEAVDGKDGLVLDEIGVSEIGGFETTVFDLSNGPQKGLDSFGGQPLISFLEDNTGLGFWHAPPLGRVWAIESDRGVLLVVAESFGRSEEDLAAIIDIAEPILESLEFIDMGS